MTFTSRDDTLTQSLKENCTPKSQLRYDRFSIESDGESPLSKFEREDGQADSEKRHVRAVVTSLVPPHNHTRYKGGRYLI